MRTRKPLAPGLIVLAAVFAMTVAAQACDAPVYLFALENWQRDPYQALYFYRDREASQDREINSYLERVASGEVENANLDFARIKLDSDDPRVDIWKHHGREKAPVHIVVSPAGVPLFVGRLTTAELKAMLRSPKRTEIAEKLCRGAQGVVLLLTSGTAADARAREICKQVVAEAREEGTAVEYAEVSRSDPAERWFVRQLLSIEPDLPSVKAPIAYGVFGRGHVLEPFVGAGITADSVRQLIAYMNGPCTCELKAANPGMDLLTAFNWAERVAGLPQVKERPASSFLMGAADEMGYAEFEVGGEEEGSEGEPGPVPGIGAADQADAQCSAALGPATDASASPTAAASAEQATDSRAPAGSTAAVSSPGAVSAAPAGPETSKAQADKAAERSGKAVAGAAAEASGVAKPSAQAPEQPRTEAARERSAAADTRAKQQTAEKSEPAATESDARTEGNSQAAEPVAPAAVGAAPVSLDSAEPQAPPATADQGGPRILPVIGFTLALAALLALGVGTVILLRRPRT